MTYNSSRVLISGSRLGQQHLLSGNNTYANQNVQLNCQSDQNFRNEDLSPMAQMLTVNASNISPSLNSADSSRSSGMDLYYFGDDTPARHSPSTKTGMSEDSNDSGLIPSKTGLYGNQLSSELLLDSTLDTKQMIARTNKRSMRRLPRAKSNDDIWGEEVESALHEILAMAPKQGSHRVKINNKSVGRNDIISTYILAKTGKYRTRKQISSHIQVLKNHGTNKALIELIKNGPTFETSEEDEANSDKFVRTFESICKQNGHLFEYLPCNGDPLISPTDPISTFEPDLDIRLSQLEFFIYSMKNGVVGLTSHIETLSPHVPLPYITVQFPGVEKHFQYRAPILHNKVKIYPNFYELGAEMHTKCKVDLSGYRGPLNCFTTVMSVGQEVLRTNEKNFTVNQSKPFLTDFWNSLFQTSEQLVAPSILTFHGITIKQVLYRPIDPESYDVLYTNVKAVLLWDFGIANRVEDAVTLSSMVKIPPIYSQEETTESPCGPFYPRVQKSSDVIQIGLSASEAGLEAEPPVELPLNNSFNFPMHRQSVPNPQMHYPLEPFEFAQNPYSGYFPTNADFPFRGDVDYTTRPQQ